MGSREYSALRHLLTAGAVAAALAAQQLTSRQPRALSGWLIFALAAAVLAAVSRAISPSTSPTPAPAPPSRHLPRRVLGCLLAVLAVGLATTLSTWERWPLLALASWMAGLIIAPLALRGWLMSAPLRAAAPWSRRESAALGALVLLAAAARCVWIESLPRYYFEDESRVGVFLLQVYRGAHIPNFFTMGWNTWPVVGLSVQGMFAPLLGLSTWSLRLSSALMGTLAVAATYLLARQMFSARVAFIAALLLAIGRTAIDFSRLGVCHAQVVLLTPLGFYLGWRALDTGKAASAVGAGIVIGLCLYSYNAGQSVPLLGLGWLVLCAVRAPRRVQRHWRTVALMAAGFVLVAFPWLFYVTDHFSFGQRWYEWTFMARSRQVGAEMLTLWSTQGSGPALALLWNQILLTWLGFTVLPAEAYALGYQGGGMLDQLSAPLFVLGLALCPFAERRGRFLLYWWGATAVLGGVLTADAPAYVRLVGLLPALAILAALPLERLLDAAAGAPVARTLTLAAVLLLLIGAGWDNWRTYFVEFPRAPISLTSELARQLQRLPPANPVYLAGSEAFVRAGTRWHHNPLTFNLELFSIDFADRTLIETAEPAHLLPFRQPDGAPLALVLGPTQVSLLSYILELYPHTKVTNIVRETPLVRVLEIETADLVAQSGLTLTSYKGDSALTTVVADPFAAWPGEATPDRRIWEGGIYWPSDRSVTMTVQASAAVDIHIAATPVMRRDGSSAVQVPLELPRGWHPITIESGATAPAGLAMSIADAGKVHELRRSDLRPGFKPEGLRALYERDGRPLLRAIDPQLNSFATESVFAVKEQLPVRMPFTATWEGALRIERPGTYELEAHSSGPYSIQLDGAPLLGLPGVAPPQTHVAHVTRSLEAGLHPLLVRWDCTRCGNPSRRVFQLYWTPPGGDKVLIPPPVFVPES